MKNSISKKALSAFLAIMMIFATMAGMFTFSASAETTDTTWAGKGNYSLAWYDENESLADATTTEPSDSSTYAEVDGKYYQVQGYTSATFIIDSAEDLAGLAVLTNARKTDLANNNNTTARTNPFFANCTFYITKDIDLTGKTWKPMAYNQASAYYYFGGNLIGNLDGNGGSVKIKGMTVNVTETGNYAAGLIGCQAGGSIKNIDLVNASVTSAAPFGAGSFVGRQSGLPYASDNIKDTRSKTVYENLTSDATITKTSTSTAAFNAAGGIVGIDANGVYKTEYINCKFTGIINNNGNKSGGIVGYGENGLATSGGKNYASEIYLTDCVVTSSSITALNIANDDSNRGAGGLVGVTKTAVYADGCYVSAAVHSGSAASVTVGGMIGRMLVEQVISFVDCHFDGMVYAENWDYCGAYIGATSCSKQNIIITNCLNTGIAMNSKAQLKTRGMFWLGYVSMKYDGSYVANTISFTNNYSAYESPYIQYLQDNKVLEDTTINGESHTSMSQITELAPSVANISTVRGTAIFQGDKWVPRTGMYPTLKVAQNLADTKYATADYSWFDYDAVDLDETVVIDDYDKLLALSKISKACSTKHTFADFITEYGINISRALAKCVTTDLFSKADVTTLDAVLAGTTTETDVKNLFIQEGLYDNSVRIGAEIKGNNWDKATFEYSVVYTTAEGITYSSVVKATDVTKCYSSIIADNPETTDVVETVAPTDSSYYFVLFVIDNIGADWTNVKINFTVSVTSGDTVTYAPAKVIVDP